jgi:hypothetical protein
MSDNGKTTKSTYKTPTLIVLGALALGAGVCSLGSSGAPDECYSGVRAGSSCGAGDYASPGTCNGGWEAVGSCGGGTTHL